MEEKGSKYHDENSIIIDELTNCDKKKKNFSDIRIDREFDDATEENENLHLTDLK